MIQSIALIASLVACFDRAHDPPATDGPADTGAPTTPTTPGTTDTTGTTGPSTDTTPGPTTSETGTPETGSSETGLTPPTDTGPPPVFDATGHWVGHCNYGGYPFLLVYDLVDTAGVITGSGSFMQAGYAAFPINVTSGSRVVDQVSVAGGLSVPGYGAFPTGYHGTLLNDRLTGQWTLHQPGYATVAIPCDLDR
jgi:hypothetical protein